MTAGLDTSVLVRLLCGLPENLAVLALRYLRERRRAQDRVIVSDWVVAETYYALRYHYHVSKRDALDALRGFLETSGVESTTAVTQVLATPRLESAKPGFVDRLIHHDYRRSGAEEMATFERAADKLPGVRLLHA